MGNRCDHTSVGVVVHKNEDVLFIKRKNFPVSFACVAGHCDGDNPEKAARRELQEEAGIRAVRMRILGFAGGMPNPCKRAGGNYHDWWIYEVLAWEGEACAGSDAAEAVWTSASEFRMYASRTAATARKLGIRLYEMANYTHRIVSDPAWQECPGLEPVWFLLLARMGNIDLSCVNP